jgi:hypothetical protein
MGKDTRILNNILQETIAIDTISYLMGEDSIHNNLKIRLVPTLPDLLQTLNKNDLLYLENIA